MLALGLLALLAIALIPGAPWQVPGGLRPANLIGALVGRRQVLEALPGTPYEHWRAARTRLGIEATSHDEPAVRPALRYTIAIWSVLGGDQVPLEAARNRLAITLILSDPALREASAQWDRANPRGTPRGAGVKKDAAFRAVAAVLLPR